MKKGIYQTIKAADNMYFINKATKEIIKDSLDLYHYTTDENNIYYLSPHYDDPKDYLVVIDNKEYELVDVLKNEGAFDNHFVVLGRNKVLQFFNFKLPYCNNYFSLFINEDIYSFLSQFNLDDLKYVNNIKDIYLIRYERREHLKGNEVIFFIYSDKEEINEKIKEKQIQELFKMIDLYSNTNYNREYKKYIEKISRNMNNLNQIHNTDLFVYGFTNEEILKGMEENKNDL